MDKNAAYPKAIDALIADKTLTKTTELRPVKYLNNMVEQDHRFIKRLVNPGMGFGSFNTARRTLRGYEAMNMIRKGQILAVEKGDILGQAEYARENFWSCCITRSEERKNFCFQAVFGTQPVKPHWGLGKKTTLLVVSGFVPPACEDGRIAH